jgi:hypothetical protein
MPRKSKDARSEAVLTFRLPRELHERLVDASAGRSLSEEMRRRLETSLESSASEQDPRFADVLTCIGYAATAAAKLQQLPEGTWENDEGARDEHNVAQRGPDITPYLAFQEAVGRLLIAFQPQGIRAASDATLARLSDQLVGLALGALGDRGLKAFASLSGRVPGTSVNFADLASPPPRTAEASRQLSEVVKAVTAATAEVASDERDKVD